MKGKIFRMFPLEKNFAIFILFLNYLFSKIKYFSWAN